MKHLHKTLSSLRWEHGTGKRIEKCGLCSSRSKDYYNRPRICKYVCTPTDYYEHSLGVVIKAGVVFKLKYNICPTKDTEKSLTPNSKAFKIHSLNCNPIYKVPRSRVSAKPSGSDLPSPPVAMLWDKLTLGFTV